MTKRRSDSWDATLTPAKRLQAFDWARQLGYHKARELIRKELKIKPPSLGAMSDWYEWMTSEVRAADLQKAIVDADTIRQTAKQVGNVSDAVAAGLGQLAMDAIVSKGDPERIKLFASLALQAQQTAMKDDEIQIKLRRLELLESKMQKARDVLEKARKKGGLSKASIAEIEQKLGLL